MATQPKRYVFHVINRFDTTRHYQSEKKLNTDDLMTSKINIAVDRGFSKAKNVMYWFKLRKFNKWSNPVTGLKITSNKRLYYGDIPKRNGKPNHLMIFIFKNGDEEVFIDIYRDFYPNNKELQRILDNYILKSI